MYRAGREALGGGWKRGRVDDEQRTTNGSQMTGDGGINEGHARIVAVGWRAGGWRAASCGRRDIDGGRPAVQSVMSKR